MLELQNLLIEWFRQFTPNVYVFGDEYGLDPKTNQPVIKPTPLISFGFPMLDFDDNSLINFNIWDRSENWINVMSIESKVSKAIPSHGSLPLDVNESIYEYFDRISGFWVEFDLSDIRRIAIEQGEGFEYRESPGKLRGGILLQRGNPFTQSVPDTDFMVKRRTGNIIIKNFVIGG